MPEEGGRERDGEGRRGSEREKRKQRIKIYQLYLVTYTYHYKRRNGKCGYMYVFTCLMAVLHTSAALGMVTSPWSNPITSDAREYATWPLRNGLEKRVYY